MTPPDQPRDTQIEPTPLERAHVARTKTSALWTAICAGVVVLILLIVFVAQNTAAVRVTFFALEGQLPLALALLIAGVAGAIIALAVSGLRILQLRKAIRRGQVTRLTR